ncbi:hypothetical protein RND81_01G068500 [Saponaria officinalis]|uniref:Uncharacterized protein n=1 Tax=Saponaria officinalis TaxID=3572 RepID=A0AAW1NGU3_SAPOF
MAKSDKLLKLRSALKKMNSFSKLRRDYEDVNNTDSTRSPSDDCRVSNTDGAHTVYVGKSLRPYNVGPQMLDNPVIKELLVATSDDCDGANQIIVVNCEVVLFEHLLWMLRDFDGLSESLDDLVEFYSY